MGFEIMSRKTYKSMCNLSEFIPSSSNNIIVFHGGKNNNDKVFCIIDFPSDWLKMSGFCATFTVFLNTLFFCRRFNFIPIVKGWDTCPYYDGFVNNTYNVFEYYFKQISSIDIHEVKTSLNYVVASHNTATDIYFEFGVDNIYNPTESYISTMGDIFREYIHLNEVTKSTMEKEMGIVFKGRKTLGVHFRGSDYKINTNMHPISLEYDDYVLKIKNIINKYGFEQIFLATDDLDFVLRIKSCYQKIVLYDDVVRTKDDIGVHFSKIKRHNHKYLLGYEVIRDAYTLANCDGLLCGLSQAPIFARIIKSSYGDIFNPLVVINKGINSNNKYWDDVYKDQSR
jgi:hypothetical protein